MRRCLAQGSSQGRPSRSSQAADPIEGRDGDPAPTKSKRSLPSANIPARRCGAAAVQPGDGGWLNRGVSRPKVVWRGPLRVVVTTGCVAGDNDEAFNSVTTIIVRRADNVAVDDVEQLTVTRLADR